MKRTFLVSLVPLLALALPMASLAASPTAPASAAAGPLSAEHVSVNFSRALPNVPGKTLTAVEVSYAPGAGSAPHRHAGSAFIYAYVVSGSIVSQVEGGKEHTFNAGESFYENPGAHHLVSRNASTTEPAKLLAVFVVDSADAGLTTPDK